MGKDTRSDAPREADIDLKIRELYDKTVEEGVPDRFLKLLQELREKENDA